MSTSTVHLSNQYFLSRYYQIVYTGENLCEQNVLNKSDNTMVLILDGNPRNKWQRDTTNLIYLDRQQS